MPSSNPIIALIKWSDRYWEKFIYRDIFFFQNSLGYKQLPFCTVQQEGGGGNIAATVEKGDIAITGESHVFEKRI